MKQVILLLLFLFSMSVNAQTAGDSVAADQPVQLTKQQRKARKQLEKTEARAEREAHRAQQLIPKADDVVYIFGVGMNFNDSTIYITTIQAVPYMLLQKKTKFLPYRSDFSLQFEQYLEGTLNLSHQTCSIFYSKNRKKASKMYYKFKKRYLDMGDNDIRVVSDEQFKFIKPEYDNVVL